jgi:uncharacterized ubiquitin-like protein YukD
MELYLKKSTGNTIKFNVYPDEPIRYFKKRIFDKEQIPYGQQNLMFRAKLLNDNKRLSECGIEKEDTINLVVKITGCNLDEVFSKLKN